MMPRDLTPTERRDITIMESRIEILRRQRAEMMATARTSIACGVEALRDLYNEAIRDQHVEIERIRSLPQVEMDEDDAVFVPEGQYQLDYSGTLFGRGLSCEAAL